MRPRAFIVSVNFGDFLAETLPYNKHHFSEIIVISSPEDKETASVCKGIAYRYVTDAFYDNGARFNKFRALERALDCYGRYGIIAFLDADIFWPKKFSVEWKRGYIYSFKRRRLLLDTTAPIPPEKDWPDLPLDPQYGECLGFTQVFHGDDPVLGDPPWHSIHLHHAALGDSYFQDKWDLSRKVWLPYDVLHLGPYASNWTGRVLPRRDGTISKEAEQLKRENKHLVEELWPGGEPPEEGVNII